MQGKWLRAAGPVGIVAASVFLIAAAQGVGQDIGLRFENQLRAESNPLFGVNGGLEASSSASIGAAGASADPLRLVTLTKQLQARVVTNNAAGDIDMMALWPNDTDPEWLIACNEDGTTLPGLQRIRISDGNVETILTGTNACDPAHRTPWGTILFGEEAGSSSTTGGRIYELINPLGTTGVTLDRTTGVFSGGTGASNFAVRGALGRNSYEGIGILPNGVIYYGNEARPASGVAGGAYFKFIPTTLRNPAAPAITSLSQSPLTSGTIYGLRLGRRGTAPGTDYGQGSNTGTGTWIQVGASPNADANLDLGIQSATLKLTGYYRPEDLQFDLVELAAGNVKIAAVNTGNDSLVNRGDRNWGEVIWLTDGTITTATNNTAIPEVQVLVPGNFEQAMMDNVAYQPGRGNWILHEDGSGSEYSPARNNDLWDCLPDGADVNDQSDGCIRIATLNDLEAEWTGGIFDATGKRFFVSVQHNVTGKGVVLEITGWK